MSRYKIIVNPISGRGNGARIIPALQAHLQELGVDFDLARTERPFHAAELAQQAAADGFEVVVAVGGDGTANEVVNGLMQAKQNGRAPSVAMGVLAAGRGNDFAHNVGMPSDLRAGCQALAAGHRKKIDIGHVSGGLFPDGRYFGNSLGIGFDAVVGFEAAKMTRLTGFVSYLVAALKTIFLYYQAPQVEIEANGETMALSALMISIMNGRRQGGIFFMAPESENDDGLFDLCIAENASKARIFTLIPRFFNGSQFGQKEIRFGQTDHLLVTAVQGVLPAHVDGETLCEDGVKLEVRLLPRQLDVVCPQNQPDDS